MAPASAADAAGARRGVAVLALRAPGDAAAAAGAVLPPPPALGRAGLLGEADHDAQDEGRGQLPGVLGGQHRPGEGVRLGRQRYVMQRRRRVGMRQHHHRGSAGGRTALIGEVVGAFHLDK